MMKPLLTIIASSFKRHESLECFLSSLKCQTNKNFNTIVINDGEDNVSRYICDKSGLANLKYVEVPFAGDWGHTPRNYGLGLSETPWILLTNHDNYYVPVFIEEIYSKILPNNIDLVTYNAIHNMGAEYLALYPQLKRGYIDMGQFISRRNFLINCGGIPSSKYDGDGILVETMVQQNPTLRHAHIDKFLFVHN